MEELWDLLDEHRAPLNKQWRRADFPVPPGCYHTVVFIWVINDAGELLITKRAPEKEEYPNAWENTGGSAIAGETSEQAARRELFEETGITPSVLTLFNTDIGAGSFEDIYAARVFGRPQVTLQPGETVDYRWVTFDELERLCASGDICEPVARRFAAYREHILSCINEVGL